MEVNRLDDDTYDKVRRAYETGRLKRAFWKAVALAFLALPLSLLAPFPALGGSLASVLLVGCVMALWRGQDWERGWLRGLFAGLVPLGFALLARPFGHGCEIGGHCYSWCMPACAVGGFVAAITMARGAARSERPFVFSVSGGIATLATGALGCSCVSLSGALALAAVYVIGSVPALIFVAREHRA